MVAERFLDFRLPSFYPSPVRASHPAMDIADFVGIFGYGPNQAQHEANVHKFETIAAMVGAAMIARAT